jgi:hypothetical protein
MAGMKIALEILGAICAMGIVTSLVRGSIRRIPEGHEPPQSRLA